MYGGNVKMLNQMKSDRKSNEFKTIGDDNFGYTLLKGAIIQYNKALCYAETSSQKSILYAARSVVYYEVGRYKLCLENIKLALDHECPINIKTEVLLRQNRCKQKFQKLGDKKDENWESFKLSHKANKEIPFIIDGIKAENSEEFGRCLITTIDLKVGDIIAIEEPYIKTLYYEYQYERCAHCLKINSHSLIPCDGCVEVMYCSQMCLEKHELCHKIFHNWKIFSYNDQLDYTEPCFNYFIRALKYFGSFSAFNDFLKSSEKSTIFDFPRLDEISSIKILGSLATTEGFECYIDKKGWPALFLLQGLKWSSSEELDIMLECFRHILNIVNTNAFAIYEDNSTKSRKESNVPGVGVYLFSSLFNHSCDNNITRFNFDNKKVFFANRPIKAGEQLFITYGPRFEDTNLEIRHKYLSKYDFECNCDACKNINMYCKFSQLPKILTEPFDPKIDKSLTTYERYKTEFKVNCEFIENNWHHHPCNELSILLNRNRYIIFEMAIHDF